MAIPSIFRQLRQVFNKTGAQQAQPQPQAIFEPSDPVLQQQMQALLAGQQIAFQAYDNYLELDSGLCLCLQPQEGQALSDARFRCCVRIQCWHALLFPEGLTEFQHALGSDTGSASEAALKQWLTIDYPVLQQALKQQPDLTVIELPLAGSSATEPLYRQIILGPVAHLASLPAKRKEDHPFCPCCLISESMEAFHELLQSPQPLGIRFFVSRDQQGQLAVDCRVNGVDFPAAQPALLAYAEKWQPRGLEFRKQYVLVRTARVSVNAAATGGADQAAPSAQPGQPDKAKDAQ